MNDKEETNERTPPPTVPLGVSKFLPPLAVQKLVNAAYRAKLFKPGSFDRRNLGRQSSVAEVLPEELKWCL